MLFFGKVNLQTHNNKHSKATKSYKCDKCGKKFRMKIDLNRHMKRENKEFRHKYIGVYSIFKVPSLDNMCLNRTAHSADTDGHFVSVYLSNFLFIFNNK